MKRNLTILFLATVMVVLFVGPGWADLTINLVAVNATEDAKTVPVKYHLPMELEPEDIIDTGPLKLDYDVNKGAYYVSGEFQFNAKESRTFKVVVKDVWQIDEIEISLLKSQLSDNLSLLEGGENYSAAVAAKDLLSERLDYILNQQLTFSQDIGRRIEQFRAYTEELEEIRRKTFSLENLEAEATGMQDIVQDKTIKLLIQVKNPSETDEKKVKQKHYLPKEIREEHVVDSKGFEVRFDNKKEASYLTKEETFKPGETKKYEIVIKDIWQFPVSKVDALEKRAQLAYDEISESIYKESGDFIMAKIRETLGEIRDSADREYTIKEHIGMYRINLRRFAKAEEDVNKLEQMLAIVRAKKLEEFEKGKVKNILQKLRALKGLAQLSEAIFKKGISVTMTWRIIVGTLIFVSLFTSWHFFIWARRSKVQGEGSGVESDAELKEVPKPGEQTEEEEEEVAA